ncbi:MAG: hypothetical protein P8J37_13300 [Fuerstiella sp.]|nr:hypothetical protein [Fuerstiella sp.]
MSRRSLLEDHSTRLFDTRRLLVGICITAAVYAILEVSRADGSEGDGGTDTTCICGEAKGRIQHSFRYCH